MSLPKFNSIQHEMSRVKPTEERIKGVAACLLHMQRDPAGIRLGPVAYPADMPDWLPSLLNAINRSPRSMSDDIQRYENASLQTVYTLDQLDAVAQALVDKYTAVPLPPKQLEDANVAKLAYQISHNTHYHTTKVIERQSDRLISSDRRVRIKRRALDKARAALDQAEEELKAEERAYDTAWKRNTETFRDVECLKDIWERRVRGLYEEPRV
jgi:hypothetical protein